MSEKLKEIAISNSKGRFVGHISDDCVEMAFQVPMKRFSFSGFRFLWFKDEGLTYKGYINCIEPSALIGFWIQEDRYL